MAPTMPSDPVCFLRSGLASPKKTPVDRRPDGTLGGRNVINAGYARCPGPGLRWRGSGGCRPAGDRGVMRSWWARFLLALVMAVTGLVAVGDPARAALSMAWVRTWVDRGTPAGTAGRRHHVRRFGADQRLLEPPGAAVQCQWPAARHGDLRRRQPRGAVRHRGGQAHRHDLRRRRGRQCVGRQVLRHRAVPRHARRARPVRVPRLGRGRRAGPGGRLRLRQEQDHDVRRRGQAALRVRLHRDRAQRAEEPARPRLRAGRPPLRPRGRRWTGQHLPAGPLLGDVRRPLPGARRRQSRAARAPDHRRGDRGQHRGRHDQPLLADRHPARHLRGRRHRPRQVRRGWPRHHRGRPGRPLDRRHAELPGPAVHLDGWADRGLPQPAAAAGAGRLQDARVAGPAARRPASSSTTRSTGGSRRSRRPARSYASSATERSSTTRAALRSTRATTRSWWPTATPTTSRSSPRPARPCGPRDGGSGRSPSTSPPTARSTPPTLARASSGCSIPRAPRPAPSATGRRPRRAASRSTPTARCGWWAPTTAGSCTTPPTGPCSPSGARGGRRSSQLAEAADVTVDATRVYVADKAKHRIKVWSKDGTFLGAFGAQGTGDGEFVWPMGLARLGEGRILVLDAGGERIQEFVFSRLTGALRMHRTSRRLVAGATVLQDVLAAGGLRPSARTRARSRACGRRCRSAWGGRSSAPCPAPARATGPASPACGRWRTGR